MCDGVVDNNRNRTSGVSRVVVIVEMKFIV